MYVGFELIILRSKKKKNGTTVSVCPLESFICAHLSYHISYHCLVLISISIQRIQMYASMFLTLFISFCQYFAK